MACQYALYYPSRKLQSKHQLILSQLDLAIYSGFSTAKINKLIFIPKDFEEQVSEVSGNMSSSQQKILFSIMASFILLNNLRALLKLIAESTRNRNRQLSSLNSRPSRLNRLNNRLRSKPNDIHYNILDLWIKKSHLPRKAGKRSYRCILLSLAYSLWAYLLCTGLYSECRLQVSYIKMISRSSLTQDMEMTWPTSRIYFQTSITLLVKRQLTLQRQHSISQTILQQTTFIKYFRKESNICWCQSLTFKHIFRQKQSKLLLKASLRRSPN